MKNSITLLYSFICSFAWTQEIYELPDYDGISSFRGGFAYVEKDGMAGLIDSTFHEVIPIQFDYIDCYDSGPFVFNDTIFAVKNEKTFLFNAKGVLIDSLDTIHRPSELLDWSARREKFGDLECFTTCGCWWANFGCERKDSTIIPFNYQAIVKGLSDNQIICYAKDSVYIYSDKGNLTHTFPRSNFTINRDKRLYTTSNGGEIEFRNQNFKPLKKLNVDRVISTNGQYYSVEKDNKAGIIDKKQRTIVPFEFDKIYLSNYFFICEKNGMSHIFYKESLRFEETTYKTSWMRLYTDSRFLVTNNDSGYQIFNQTGKLVAAQKTGK